MRSRDAKIHEELVERLGFHRGPTISVYRKHRGVDSFPFNRVGKEFLGKHRVFAVLESPAHHVAAVDVDDNVKLEVRPLLLAEQLCNIPTPNEPNGRCDKLGFDTRRMCCKCSPFFGLARKA